MSIRFNPRVLLAAGILGLLGGGCGGNGRLPVQGTVTYKGQPLAEGTIQFFAKDNANITESSLIKGGKYALPSGKGLPPGNYRVEISAPESKGARPDPGAAPGAPRRFKELLPEQYNTHSILTIDVTASSDGNYPFALR